MYWEDRLSKDAHDAVEHAILKFRDSNKSRYDEDVIYMELTNAGMTAEEADEFINLEMEIY